ncbi:kinase-like domain-containing protein [Geopyxis carbonaria]|nr:kinase-like domain-containing protein [Geopyxis carbonaria]
MPLANGNLYEYLKGNEDSNRPKWAYKPVDGCPLHKNGIWLQVAGVLDALYNFQSPLHAERRGHHSDLKPQNILVFDAAEEMMADRPWYKFNSVINQYTNYHKGRRLVIGDFGQAYIGRIKQQTNARRNSATRQRAGTNVYLPPECDINDTMNTKYDVWSMGCIIIEILVYVAKGSEVLRPWN